MCEQEVRYAGIDLHRKYSVITIMDKSGNSDPAVRINNYETEKLKRVLSQSNKFTQAVVESTYGWYWLSDLVDEMDNVDLKLGHALGIKALTSSKKKTDKIDSKLLANLLRVDLLPESHQTSKKHRAIKDILRHRMYLVRQRSSLKRRLHAMLAKVNLLCPYTNILGVKSRRFLEEELKDKYPYNLEVKTTLAVADSLDEQIKECEKEVDAIVDSHPDVDLIMSVPGIGKIAGLTLLSEIDGIERFSNPRKLCSYAGLVPSTRSSGDKTYQGPTREGDKYIRNMLAETFYHTIKKDPYLLDKYETLKEKKGSNKAKVAVMRRILTSIYYVLKNQEPYQIRSVNVMSKLD